MLASTSVEAEQGNEEEEREENYLGSKISEEVLGLR
jgi:hypothetical protein